MTVTARRAGEMIELSVADDGPGIEAGAIVAGHGIENTRERLRALYGDRASLEIRSRGQVGTIATLHLPYARSVPSVEKK